MRPRNRPAPAAPILWVMTSRAGGSALPLYAKPICADAAIHPERATDTAASIGIFSVELAHDARF
jgi:hypothetical protein